MSRANYSRGHNSRGDIVLTDLGWPWDKYQTITNDAEGVIRDLAQAGLLRPGIVRVFYYDSEGVFDQLLYDPITLEFAGFAPASKCDAM